MDAKNEYIKFTEQMIAKWGSGYEENCDIDLEGGGC